MKIKFAKLALRISLIYAVVGGLWILFSGWALSALISNPEIRAQWEICKGWGFVAVTALLLYLLLRGKLWRWELKAIERKRAEGALRNSEQLLRLVMDLVPHFIFVKDKQSRHLLVNRACAEACKLKPEQMIGRSDLDLAPGSALAESYMKDDQEVIASGRPKFVPEEKLTDAHGRTRFLQTTKIPFPSSAISSPFAGNNEPAILGIAVDITERKKAEDALRQKQDQLVEAMRIARLAYWEYDVPTDRFTFNDQFYSILHTTAEREGGYTMSAAKYIKRFIHPDDAVIINDEIQKALATTDPNYNREFDHRVVSPNGEVGHFYVHLHIQKDAQGRTVKSYGTIMDITERKRAEVEVRLHGEIMRNMAEGVVLSKVSDATIVYTNPEFEKMFGYGQGELIGKNISVLNAPIGKTPKEVAEDIQRSLKKTGMWNGEVCSIKKDGTRFWCYANVTTFKHPEYGAVWIAVHSDITERKQTEAALRENHEEFKDLFDNAPVGFHEIDAEGRVVRINQTELKMLGYSAEELLGQFVWKISADEELSRRAALAKLKGEKPPAQGFERAFRRKDGSIFPVFIKDRLLKQAGRVTGIRAAIQDITERKQAEETLAKERNLLKTLVDTTPDLIYFKDLRSRFVQVSKSTLELLFKSALNHNRATSQANGAGKLPVHLASLEEFEKYLVGKTDFDFLDEERAQSAYQDEQEVIQTGKPIVGKLKHSTETDGTVTWRLNTRMPWRDKAGNIIGTIGVSRDVTAIKEGEAKLAHERELFQTLLETTPDNIYFKDLESRFVRFSRSKAEDTLQTVRQTYHAAHPEMASEQWPPPLASVEAFTQWLIGKTDFDTYPEAHARAAYNNEQEIIRTGRPLTGKLEKATLPNGKDIWWLTTKLPWHDKDGHIIGTFGVSKDVTALKGAEAALNQERLLLRTLVDNLPDLIYAKDVGGRKILSNPADVKTCKCQTEAELIGKSDFDIYPRDIAEKFWADDRKVIQGQSVINREEYFLDEKGRKRWLLTSKLPLYNQNKEIMGLVGIGRDITERRQAEETSAAQQKLLDSLIAALPDLVYFKDRESRFLRINEAYAKRAGLPDVHAAVGKTDFDIYGEHHAREAYEDEQRIVATGQPIINKEEQEKWPDGRVTWVISTKMPLLDSSGKIIGTMGISRDITDRKLAEEELRQVNRSLQTLSKCNEALVRATDETSLLTKVCQIAAETGGYKLAWVGYAEQDEAKSVRPVAWAGLEGGYLKNLEVTWADTERGHGPTGRAIRTGQPSIFLNLAQHPDFAPWREEALRHGFAACISLPLKADNKTFGVLSVFSSRPDAFNVTETALLKELADDLAFGITTLRNRAERKQLEEQLRQSQKMEAIGQLAGGVAHDFNNMLTVIQGNASLLSNPQLNAGERTESAQQVVRAAERAASLTRQLLLFSRKQVMQAVPLSLNEVVGNMTKMLQRILGEHISLNANYAPNLPVIQADPGMIEQILLNLVVNSRDAMPHGGRLTITTSAETLDKNQVEKTPGAAPGLYTCLNVTDTGCGIAPENLPRIFEPFFTTKEVGKGTGLGLATVYGIVQQHHGWIAVDSQVDRGTTFRIYLPAAEGESAKLAGAATTLKLPGGNETILLVEDEPPVRLLVNNLLQRCGYTVLEAESGVAALAIWKEHREKIHLLLTDMIMPEGISGHELAEKLKSDRPELKVIYTTGHSADVIGREPKLIEGTNFLQKPYQPIKLAQIVRNCLDQKPASS